MSVTQVEARDAKVRSVTYYDQTAEQKIVSRDAVRQELWTKHLQNPVLALTEALRRVDGSTEAEIPLLSPSGRRKLLQLSRCLPSRMGCNS